MNNDLSASRWESAWAEQEPAPVPTFTKDERVWYRDGFRDHGRPVVYWRPARCVGRLFKTGFYRICFPSGRRRYVHVRNLAAVECGNQRC